MKKLRKRIVTKSDDGPFTIHVMREPKKSKSATTNQVKKAPNKEICFTSFGFKYGVQTEDFWKLINLQKLPNPSFAMRKNQTGLSEELQKEFFSHTKVEKTYQTVLHELLTDLSKSNGKLVIMIGCHSGKHRSVAFVERISQENFGCDVQVFHRDVNKSHVQDDKKKQRKQKTHHQDEDY